MIRSCVTLSFGAIVACGGATAQTSTAQSTVQSAPAVARGQAFGLVMDATACWMGGLWADALGEKSDARDEGIAQRCKNVVRAVDAPADFEKPLRAVDATSVERIAQKVAAIARTDDADRAHGDELTGLLGRIADGARETMHARLAADQVKEDAAKTPAPDEYTADKNAAGPVLEHAEAMQALLADRSPYRDAAHAIGLLIALDRTEIAHGLPKHLKIDVVGPSYASVFGVSAPSVSGAPADRSPPGVWLTYLGNVAAAARHRVPDDLTALPDRETYAWSAVLEGFADKLREDPAFSAQTSLGEVVRNIVARLDDGWGVAKALLDAKRHG